MRAILPFVSANRVVIWSHKVTDVLPHTATDRVHVYVITLQYRNLHFPLFYFEIGTTMLPMTPKSIAMMRKQYCLMDVQAAPAAALKQST